MEKLENNFEQRLKKYSEEIKSMEIVYQDGRVKCINKKDKVNFKARKKQVKDNDIKSCMNKYIITSDEESYNIKTKYKLILKIIFICTLLISVHFMANICASIGLNEFISGILSLFIYYFIICMYIIKY